MHYTIHQNISIHFLRVGSISNSSVLQIGSAGVIQSSSNLYNTGDFEQPAPEAEAQEQAPFVPLAF
ncbi:spore germination protein GerPB [Pontibacillus salicampi]|uniref:Spore germination protein GerPB n=1 Tax=Pontibacillus salicampi TaxID=1449801 RepID=A0ABV6LRH9_9BACI